MSQGMEAVRRICEGWNTMTQQDWREVCTPDVAYQNMPWDRTVVTGPDAIYETLKSFGGAFDVRMEFATLTAVTPLCSPSVSNTSLPIARATVPVPRNHSPCQ